MPFSPTICSRCQQPFKDNRGLAAHTRRIHPVAVADKPIVESTKKEARELAADADIEDFRAGSASPVSVSVPESSTLKPEIVARLPSSRWLQKYYPVAELPTGHVMCPKCDEESFLPEPLAVYMCHFCRKFFS